MAANDGNARTTKHRSLAWLGAVAVTALLALAVVPTLSGGASAAPIAPAAGSGSPEQWAYGGQGWSNNSITVGNTTATWDAWFGWTVVFTATNTTYGTLMVEEQRTVGVTVHASLKNPEVTASYFLHGQELDAAFVNLTNQSTVYENGQAVAALGLDNASASASAAIAEDLNATVLGHTASLAFSVNGAAHATVSFSPALGLIPLNLTGSAPAWNSTSTASGAANWNLSWAFVAHGFNGTGGSASQSTSGSVNASGPISLHGMIVHAEPVFSDHKDRTGVVLIISGPFDDYDGFVLVPHDFDLFGGAAHQYDQDSMGGSASVASGAGETLYVANGPRGPQIQAATSTFGAADIVASPTGLAQGPVGPAAGVPGPGATVTGQPMSVASAQAESKCLTSGCTASGPAATSGWLVGLAIAIVVVAIVATVGVVEWNAYLRRKMPSSRVLEHGLQWQGGVPPAASAPGAPQPPTGAASGPSAPGEPPRSP